MISLTPVSFIVGLKTGRSLKKVDFCDKTFFGTDGDTLARGFGFEPKRSFVRAFGRELDPVFGRVFGRALGREFGRAGGLGRINKI